MGFIEIVTHPEMFQPPGGWNRAFNSQEIVMAQNQYIWLTQVKNMKSSEATKKILKQLYGSRWMPNSPTQQTPK